MHTADPAQRCGAKGNFAVRLHHCRLGRGWRPLAARLALAGKRYSSLRPVLILSRLSRRQLIRTLASVSDARPLLHAAASEMQN